MNEAFDDDRQPGHEIPQPSSSAELLPEYLRSGNEPPSSSSTAIIATFETPRELTAHWIRGRFIEARDAWLARSPSINTRVNYARDLAQFLSFCGLTSDQAEGLAAIRPPQVAAWRDHLRDRGLANSSILRKMTALRSLFSYLQAYGYAGANPAHNDFVQAPAVPRDGKTVGLTPEDCRQLLDAPDRTTPAGIRDRAILGVLAYSACRVGELARLKVGDYKMSAGHRLLEIFGKGGKERRTPLHAEAVERIEAWLDAAGIREQAEGPLFRAAVTARGRGHDGFRRSPLTRRAIQLLIRRYVRELRLDPAVTVHSLRVTALTTARERGADIGEHIEEYQTHLVANARSESHVSETIRLLNRVVRECGYRVLADLQSGGDLLEEHLAARRKEGAAHRTINADLVAIRSFCRWLLTKKRMREDPTLGLRRLNVEEDRRRERRALTDDEAQRLIDAAHRSTRDFKRLTGKDRAVMYTLAQRTGLRRRELRSLTPGSFDLQSSPLTVQVEAASSKRRKRDLLPLPEDLAKTIQEYVAGRTPQEKLWPGSWWRRSAEMLRLDLAHANIEPVDAQGRVVDFHGQRTTFITALARAGVSPATAQRLARHSDINLTMGTYTRLQMKDMAGAVDKLAELRRAPAQPEQPPTPATTEAADPSLGRVVALWDSLPQYIRQTILKLIEMIPNGKDDSKESQGP